MENENENVELSATDEAELQKLLSEGGPITHTLLEIWREVLSNVEGSKAEKVTPIIANRIVGSWPKLSIQDTPAYHVLYHDFLLAARDILEAEIKSDPEALNNTEDDAVENRQHYLNLLLEWQVEIMRWEAEWDAAADDAHISLAAIADAAAFITGQNGLLNHLSSINFEFTDADQQDLADLLTAAKEDL